MPRCWHLDRTEQRVQSPCARVLQRAEAPAVRAAAAQRAVLRDTGLNQMPLHGRQQSLAIVQCQAERIEPRIGIGAATAGDFVGLLRSIGPTQFDRHTPFHSRPQAFRAATVAPPYLGRSLGHKGGQMGLKRDQFRCYPAIRRPVDTRPVVPHLGGEDDDFLLEPRQQLLRFRQGQTQSGDITETARPIDLQDAPRPRHRSPPTSKSRPRAASVLSPRGFGRLCFSLHIRETGSSPPTKDAAMPSWPMHPQLCGSPGWELGAGIPPAGICAGGGTVTRVLPRCMLSAYR
jgi:hypothetical protein